MALRQIQGDGPTDPDELGLAQGTDRVEWGLPSDEGLVGQHPGVIPNGFDYGAGVLVGHGVDADAQAMDPVHHLIRARVDAPQQFQLPHEATHRRYEPPLTTAVAQSSAGFTLIAPSRALHFVKVISCMLLLSAGGTIKFVHGNDAGTQTQDLSGAAPFAGNGGFVLSPAELQNPWLYTSPSQALGIISATGLASGFVTYVYSPYDQ